MPILFLGDHPRLCGEKHGSAFQNTSSWGSPPPMRGKDNVIYPVLREERITPAYAGKSCFHHIEQPFPEDHPRLCGEKQPDTFGQLTQLGSPPPMRGKEMEKESIERDIRITPAYAGKRRKDHSGGHEQQDHPRLCGEKLSDFSIIPKVLGSPPPMRGKENACVTDEGNIGITPAYAGKSNTGM